VDSKIVTKPDQEHGADTAAADSNLPAIDPALPAIVVAGEVLWDVFETSERLGGAPLNFAARARHYGHRTELISALGADKRGRKAREAIAALGLDNERLKVAPGYATGTARVRLDASGSAEFSIERPAAYDAIALPDAEIAALAAAEPGWLYFGTLLAALPPGRHVLDLLIAALGRAQKFYDLNLRPGADTPDLVTALMHAADVVKLSESELEHVGAFTGLPADPENFCRAASERFGWHAVAVTLAERGSALLAGGEFATAPAVPVTVVDTVGAGDAYAAAMMHGLSLGWRAAEIAAFANRAGAAAAAQSASLPAY
jgi:fructokinase